MTVTIQRSAMVLAYLLCTHLLALGAVWVSQAGLAVSSVVVIMVVFNLLVLCQRYQWLSAKKCLTEMTIDSNNHVTLGFSDNTKQGPYVLISSVVFHLALVIYLKPVHGRLSRAVFIARDASNAKAYRRLRVRLRDPDSWG